MSHLKDRFAIWSPFFCWVDLVYYYWEWQWQWSGIHGLGCQMGNKKICYWSNRLFPSNLHNDWAIAHVSFIVCIKGYSYVRLVNKIIPCGIGWTSGSYQVCISRSLEAVCGGYALWYNEELVLGHRWCLPIKFWDMDDGYLLTNTVAQDGLPVMPLEALFLMCLAVFWRSSYN